MKAQRGIRLELYSFFNLVWWSTPRPSRGTSGKETQYPCTGGWVGPRAGLYGKSHPHRNRSPYRPALSESLYRLCYPGPYYYSFAFYWTYFLSSNSLISFVSFASWSPSFVGSDGKLRYFHPSVGSFNPRAAYMCTYMETIITWKRHQSNTHTHTHTHTHSSTARIVCA